MRALRSKRRSCFSADNMMRAWHSWSPGWGPGWSPSSGVTLGKRRLRIYIPIFHCLVFRIRLAGAQNKYSGFPIFRLFTDLKLVNSVYYYALCIPWYLINKFNIRILKTIVLVGAVLWWCTHIGFRVRTRRRSY